MWNKKPLTGLLAGISLFAAPVAHAAGPLADGTLAQAVASSLPAADPAPLWLAQVEQTPAQTSLLYIQQKGEGERRKPWVTGNELHKYLGLGSLLVGGLTMLSAGGAEGGEGDEGGGENNYGGTGYDIHRTLALSATALGLGAVATGFLFHGDDIGLENGLTDPDNLHMSLGLLGTLGYVSAVSAAPGESHAGSGTVGGISMLVAVKIAW